MLLKRLLSAIPERLHAAVSQLDAVGIKMTENIIFTPPDVLCDHVPGIDKWQIDDLVECCIRLTAPSSSTAEEVLEVEEGRKVCYAGWGVRGLDSLMGDWNGHGILEISGPQRTGKSLLVLQLVLRHLSQFLDSTCRWLDTDGSFTAARAQAVLQSMRSRDTSGVLERLIVSPCYQPDPYVLDTISTIRSEEDSHTRLLVIDSITPLLRDSSMGSGAQGHASMVNLLDELSELVQEKGLTLIVINATASSRPSNPQSHFTATDVKPALGIDFTYFADITLLVQSTARIFGEIDEGERDRAFKQAGLRGVVEVSKSRVSPTGRWAVFETDGKNLMDVVPAPTDDERTIRRSAGQRDDDRPLHGPLRDTLF